MRHHDPLRRSWKFNFSAVQVLSRGTKPAVVSSKKKEQDVIKLLLAFAASIQSKIYSAVAPMTIV